MKYTELRTRVRGIILIIAGLVSFFIIFEIFFDLFKVSKTHFVINILSSIAAIFIGPFRGIAVTNADAFVNVDAVIALTSYVLGAIVLSEIITAFLRESTYEIFQNFVDAIFKVVEFLIFIRIIVVAFSAAALNIPLATTIVNLTNWTQGVVTNFPLGSGFLDLSAIVVLGVVIFLDLLSERLIEIVAERVRLPKIRFKRKTKITMPSVPKKEAPPINQNITINIPVPKEIPPQKKVIVVNQNKKES